MKKVRDKYNVVISYKKDIKEASNKEVLHDWINNIIIRRKHTFNEKLFRKIILISENKLDTLSIRILRSFVHFKFLDKCFFLF